MGGKNSLEAGLCTYVRYNRLRKFFLTITTHDHCQMAVSLSLTFLNLHLPFWSSCILFGSCLEISCSVLTGRILKNSDEKARNFHHFDDNFFTKQCISLILTLGHHFQMPNVDFHLIVYFK
jgi:hypothetical protein